MPTEQEPKPYTFRGCGGTMTYSERALPPGARAGSQHEGGQVVWADWADQPHGLGLRQVG